MMSFSVSARSADADYGAYHQASFSLSDALAPTPATPERTCCMNALGRSALPEKPKAVDSVNEKVVSAGYKDRPGWSKVSDALIFH